MTYQQDERMTVRRNFEDAPVVLSVDHISKSFKLPTEQATGLKQAVINWTKGIKGFRRLDVLKDISFEVHQGEFFGIVGRNGGGKSTLLKLISQIYYPETGQISVTGKLVPFIELGVGFNPELTGRENVYLNGALLGFTHEQVDGMYDDIVEFAELQDFMDQKLKNYSSGMQVRLAFSVAIKAQGDILVLDEVLAVGDEAFQRKCDDFFTEIKKDPTKTVILVTHDMNSVKRYCSRALMIADGEVEAAGDPETVSQQYTLANLAVQRAEEKQRQEARGGYANGLNERCPILRTSAVSSQVCSGEEPFVFDVEYQYDEPGDFYLAIALHDTRRGGITYDTGAKVFKVRQHGHHTIRFSLPLDAFNNGEFRLITSLRTPMANDPRGTDAVGVALDENSCSFAIRNDGNDEYALLSDRALVMTPVDDSLIETVHYEAANIEDSAAEHAVERTGGIAGGRVGGRTDEIA
ncbi:MAG: ABC transporter ATP-binding protein [Bifidobacterium tibiigranuli]|jgi:ABC-2 type transport system ATP-binding protein|uniref:ABC transporter ATP-binding protein n=1 Tax=Bifidobacterium tibiigranuli TaxID=2172043 RepID=UPI00235530F7|nr:ABC transporter ATP-binding protein [Bifidobacterium tibiigranuli]MCH3975792.1 ABC transporter ATP-binding protein [Bifidobacterium tibiigranuli]MCH4189288.1 ABC transporter ATP-binding protein [Bifidobacterium tibiigranuli]MCH4203077.1 ABC transporter ATP-binding protein [Bifidobacterium tibiigranuli]MCH4274774.1 ABC transporter ATP-binding protein [Bifidobacterium tibiigranuli]